MTKYTYKVSSGEAINRWQRTSLVKEPVTAPVATMDVPVNLTEGYLDIEYPVRRHFLEQKPAVIKEPSDSVFEPLYIGFDNPRVDFSTFLSTPHWLQTNLRSVFTVAVDSLLEFDLTTCGRVCLWVNQKLITDFQPYTRNFGSVQRVSLPLQAGDNHVTVYLDELAERDVNFYVELRLVTETELLVSLPLSYEAVELAASIRFLEALYFQRDVYTEGPVALIAPKQADIKAVKVHFNRHYFRDEAELDGNIADFKRPDKTTNIINNQILLGHVEELPTSGLTTVEIELVLPDGSKLAKGLRVAIYNRKKLDISLGETINERKQKALRYFADLEMMDLNSGIAELALGNLSANGYQKLRRAFKMIEDKGDCADFMFAPLLMAVINYQDELEADFLAEVKEIALDFRYWIDEPGDDVMWYFSENHALLFHICQYFAGDLYPEALFQVSQRSGRAQRQLGKQRLEEWFATFFAYGFSEWNSTTYLPIDLIGFFALYLAAPDEALRLKAKDALDYTFQMLALNHHGGLLSASYGRVYEHDLKAMALGEISNLLAITWDQGHFNNAMRSPVLLALSDYEPPIAYERYLLPQKGQALKAEYTQGINQVYSYMYKTRDYSLGSVIDFNAYQKGHQQHGMTISLGLSGTQLWLNHPGEFAHSGENRPSFWAGNGFCPKMYQVDNLLALHYRLPSGVPYIHLYLPRWDLSEIRAVGNWLYIRKDEAYLALYFSAGFVEVLEGDTRQREIRAVGSDQRVLVKCSSKSEMGSFERFSQLTDPKLVDEGLHFVDPQLGAIHFSETQVTRGSSPVDYDGNYDINPQEIASPRVEKRGSV